MVKEIGKKLSPGDLLYNPQDLTFYFTTTL